MRIAIDAMGGDRGPTVMVEGTVRVLRDPRCPEEAQFLLVGDQEKIEREFHRLRVKDYNRSRLMVEHASEEIPMDSSSPVADIRRLKDSSISVALKAVKEGRADGFLSAGNTGAAMAASTLSLGRLPGIDRPAIATVMPTLRSHMILLDVGANVECHPENLFQFAIMGSVYARFILGLDSPTVGLLSNGEEAGKGTPLVREAFELLKNDPSVNFIGNLEGRDLVKGTADVVVTDGFLGNIILKYGESLAQGLGTMLKAEITRSPLRKIGAALILRKPLQSFKEKVDYSEFGGAPLLGLKQPCFICHGSSNAKAVKNAARIAVDFVRADVSGNISRLLAEHRQFVPSAVNS